MGIKLESIWTQWEFSSDTVRPQGHKSLYPSSCSRLEALFCIPFKDNQAFGASSNSLKAEFIFVCYWRQKVDSALSKNSVWSCGPWTKLTSLTFIYQFATQPNQFIAVDEPTSWSCFFFLHACLVRLYADLLVRPLWRVWIFKAVNECSC